jgi:hypothetical protein
VCGRRRPPPAAAVQVVGWPPLSRRGRSRCCSPAPSELRTTGRGVARRTVGFAQRDEEAVADGSGALAAVGPVDASSVLAVPVPSFVDVDVDRRRSLLGSGRGSRRQHLPDVRRRVGRLHPARRYPPSPGLLWPGADLRPCPRERRSRSSQRYAAS